MNSNAVISPVVLDQTKKPNASLLANWILAGVIDFGRTRLRSPSITFTQAEYGQQLASFWQLSRADWPAIRANTRVSNLFLVSPLKHIIHDYQLALTDIFLLGLCGEVENNYELNLALAELQEPDQNPRPRMHLLCELLNHLFDADVTPIDFIHHPLVNAGILQIIGNEPMPLRYLQINECIWALLMGKRVVWPDVTPLTGGNPVVSCALQTSLSSISQYIRLGHTRTLVLRGALINARNAARELAQYLNMQAVNITSDAWQREKNLHIAARYGQWLPVVEPLLGPGDIYKLPDIPVPQVVICGNEGMVQGPAQIELDVPGFTLQERQVLWQECLESPDLAKQMAESSLIDGANIQVLSEMAQAQAAREKQPLKRHHILESRLRQGSHRLRQLAQPVLRQLDRDALILPPGVDQQIEQLMQRCKKREALWQNLGTTAKASLNLGIRVLFSGESGTGKTLAASYIATQLGAPLYRVDLASVMNKYIGETEKNLGLLLDEAAASDTILLLDEADALFGKRTDASSANDRFANMLTNYLLTRIETHPGVVILTSNGRSRIDSAFTRRLDAIIEFTPPSSTERFLIWQSHLGERSPGEQFLQMLSSYSELPGGFIRNAVLSAAIQVDIEESLMIPPQILLGALIDEYRKLGKAIPTKLEQLATSLVSP